MLTDGLKVISEPSDLFRSAAGKDQGSRLLGFSLDKEQVPQESTELLALSSSLGSLVEGFELKLAAMC